MKPTQPQVNGGGNSEGPDDERRNRRWFLVGLVFIAGWSLGLFVFGWWLTPAVFEGARLKGLNNSDKEAFLVALTDLFDEERDIEHIRARLVDWPAADLDICQVAAETENEILAVRLTALATELNGEGCMRVVYRQFDESAETGRQFTAPAILILGGLFVLLVADVWLIGRVSRRLSNLRRQQARDEALAGVTDEGSSKHIFGRVLRAPFTLFVIRRLLSIPITLLIITAVIFAIISIAEPAERASLYLPPRTPSHLTPERMQEIVDQIIEEHGLDDPYPVQYVRWLGNLLRGDWGWSPILQAEVLPALLHRTGVTLELTVYTLLFFIPLGIISGVLAGWRADTAGDHRFRTAAFVATSLPPFILGLFLLSIFYVGLRWFPPGRTSIFTISFSSSDFVSYTGMLTIDGLLNGRLDVTYDAFRHLILPVFVLGLSHWATLGRITRASIIEVKDQDYIRAARARGVAPRALLWRHSLRNAISPGLTNSSLAIASLITGVFIIEVIFDLNGLSELALLGMQYTPDAALALGFAVYTALLVLPFMLLLDIIRAAIDPRAELGQSQ